MMRREVLKFISRFTRSGSASQVIDTFTNGCCYWFATVLCIRFSTFGAVMMYDQVANHWGVQIGSAVYDITGDVTEQYDWIPYQELSDPLLRARLARDCIYF